MSSPYRYTIELCPPIDPSKIEPYYRKFQHLLEHTRSFNITSHQTEDGLVAGFYRSYNLANYLLHRHPDLSLLVHVTCFDLDRVNVRARLGLLKSLGVKRILAVTGENYGDKPRGSPLMFQDSSEMLDHIKQNYGGWFELVAIATYPQAVAAAEVIDDGYTVAKDDEVDRVVRKSMGGFANAVYTQCIFSLDGLGPFFGQLTARLPSTQIVPTLALFNSMDSLDKSARLIKLMPHHQWVPQLSSTESSERTEMECLEHLKLTCRQLKGLLLSETSDFDTVEINICPFGLFDLASKLIESLEADCKDV